MGYWVIAFVLLPIYYRMNLISIYSFLQERMGVRSQKTGALFFNYFQSNWLGISLVPGCRSFATGFFSMRFGIPFSITVLYQRFFWYGFYTYRGGIKTIVWTDSLQTIFLLSALIFYNL